MNIHTETIAHPYKEKGIIFIFFALLLIPLLGFVSLAFDLAETSKTAIVTQRALDSSALSAMAARSRVNYQHFTSLTGFLHSTHFYANLRLHSAAKDSLQQGGIPVCDVWNFVTCVPHTATFTGASYNDNNDSVTLSYTRDVPLVFGSLIAGVPELPVTVTSSAQLKPATIIIMADVSGTMDCLANQRPDILTPTGVVTGPAGCQCYDPSNAATYCPNVYPEPRAPQNLLKIDVLKIALKRFVRMLNPNNTQLLIVRYATRAEPIFPTNLSVINPLNTDVVPGSFNLATVDTQIDNFIATAPGTKTNISEAFYEGLQRITQWHRIRPGNDAVWVLFAGGAPTAATISFDDDSNNIKDDSLRIGGAHAFASARTLYYKITHNGYFMISPPILFHMRGVPPPLSFIQTHANRLYQYWPFIRSNPFLMYSAEGPPVGPDYEDFYRFCDRTGTAPNDVCTELAAPYSLTEPPGRTIEARCSYGLGITHNSGDSPNCNLKKGTHEPLGAEAGWDGAIPKNSATYIPTGAPSYPQDLKDSIKAGYKDVVKKLHFCEPTCVWNPNDMIRYDFKAAIVGGMEHTDIYRSQYYASIMMADYVRDLAVPTAIAPIRPFRSSRVYVIGLGPDPLVPSPAPASPDHFEGMDDDHSRKDYFLSRIANDPYAKYVKGAAQTPPTWPEKLSEKFVYAGGHDPNMHNYCPGFANGDPERICGQYFPATSPQEVEAAFSTIAKKSLLTLVP